MFLAPPTAVSPRARAPRSHHALVLAAAFACLSCADGRGPITAPVTPTPGTPPIQAAVNVAPSAQFAISPRWPAPGDTVTFDGRYAHDGDGQVQRYRWSLGDAVSQVTGAVAKTVFRTAGTYSIALTTVDDDGDSTTTSMSLTVSASGTPTTAVSPTLSDLTVSSPTVAGGGSVTATVIARNTLGATIAGTIVGFSSTGRRVGLTPLSVATDGTGTATSAVSSPVAQTTVLRAVVNFTALEDTVPVTVTPSVIAPASAVRLTQTTLVSTGDSALLEITARDTAGNPVSGAAITVNASPAGLAFTNVTATDANGRSVVTVKSTVCSTTHTLSITAGGVTLSAAPTIQSTAAPVYGICGAELWFDALDAGTMTASGGILTAWSDKSGNGRHATVPVGPTIESNNINGRTALRFDGVNDVVPIADVLSGSPYTVLFVARRRANQTYFLGGTTSAGSSNFHIGYSSSTNMRMSHWFNDLNTTVPAFANAFVEMPRAWAARWQSGTRTLRVDGALMNSDADTNTLASWTGAAIGRRDPMGYDPIDFGELVIFRKYISEAEREAAERALMVKWGIGLMTRTAGNSQSATAGTSPAVAPQVRITDAAGVGLAGATVVFQVTGGGGRLSGATLDTIITDASGYATLPSSSWVLDYGTNELTAWYGTTAGMGRSSTFTGTGTLPSGLAMQYDGNASATLYRSSACTGTLAAVGDSVGCWLDRTANVRHVTQDTAAYRPIVGTFGSTGRSALTFTIARENYLSSYATGLSTLATTSRTIVAVARANQTEDNVTNSSSSIVLFQGYHAGLNFNGYPAVTSISAPQWSQHDPVPTGQIADPSLSYTANAPIVATQVLTVSGGSFTSQVVRNGSSTASSTRTGTPTGYSNIMRIGQGNTGATTPYRFRLDGQIAEIMIFSRALNSTERLQVERYMGWKWGITVP